MRERENESEADDRRPVHGRTGMWNAGGCSGNAEQAVESPAESP